jgi:hypothetical protein
MNAQELHNLQEAYMEVYEEKGDIKDRDEKASKQKADARMSGTKAITAYQSSAGYISKGEGEQRLNTVKKKINKELEKRKEKVGNRNLTFSRTKGDDALKIGKSPRNQKEDYDLYDIILSHLLDEGYADTEQAAEAIMVNMGEEWRESIMERREHDEPGEDDRNPDVRSHNRAVGYKSKPKQKYGSYDKRDRGGSEEDHEKSLGLQNLMRSVQGSSVKKSG